MDLLGSLLVTVHPLNADLLEEPHMRLAIIAFAVLLASPRADAQDWSGFFGGVSIGTSDGTQTSSHVVTPLSGSAAGLFAGYNLQYGKMVYGAEIAYSDSGIAPDLSPGLLYNDAYDLKMRIGFSRGRTLLYGIVGWSEISYSNPTFDFEDKADGASIGIGAERRVARKIFYGVEILHRKTNFRQLNFFG